ncbi:hypothetical protein [Helcococcus kunzii]|uniref:Uncharacterized protein n=1 Tax=Helcococcus kunzii ATCC 51366 TaxID=883114 RepID=H3NPF9_9FIRM|nr:hypothetical protein [Helcococcus kunzii]EHR33472.1 hypothetical protein HMPREF9709_01220 [Helcococcus kunzii ATCC 51366]
MEKFELIDTKEKFELKVNGEPIPNIVGYKIEATPFNKKLYLELDIPKKDIKVQAVSS